ATASSGTVGLGANAGVTITGTTGVSLTLSGIHTSARMFVEGGNQALWQATATVGSGGGQVNVSGTSGVDIQATGTGAAVNLSATSDTSAVILIHGATALAGGSGSHSGNVQVKAQAGTANMTATGGVNIGATGLLTANAGKKGDLSIQVGSHGAEGVQISAGHTGKASLDVNASVAFGAASIQLAAGQDLRLL